jgi:pimeloyl-ACP methyl ester carboxylesterase
VLEETGQHAAGISPVSEQPFTHGARLPERHPPKQERFTWADTRQTQASGIVLFAHGSGSGRHSPRNQHVAEVLERGGLGTVLLDLLTADALTRVRAPTLLIVGGHDEPVIGLNRAALERLGTTKQLEIVPGATHLFEEPGTRGESARPAREHLMP